MMRFTLANLPPAETSIEAMVRLRDSLEALRRTCGPITDEAMDMLTEAVSDVEDQIVAAEPTCSRDVAAKFRLAASLIADDDGGPLSTEAGVVYAALGGLAQLRKDDGKQTFCTPNVLGRCDDFFREGKRSMSPIPLHTGARVTIGRKAFRVGDHDPLFGGDEGGWYLHRDGEPTILWETEYLCSIITAIRSAPDWTWPQAA